MSLLSSSRKENRKYSQWRSWKNKRAVVLSESLWRTSAACRGTDRSNTSWPLPARVAGPQCGTSARTTSSLKSATTATEYVLPPALTQSLTHSLLLNLVPSARLNLSMIVYCFFVFFQMHCSGLAWNPEVATQLVVASEDDRLPVIQMWDLRFATSPLKILENHTR